MLFLLLLSVSANAQNGPNYQQFDQIMNGVLKQYNIPGGALSIARGGQLVYANGYGFADVQNRVPFRPDTLFCLASCSKSLTAAACLHLVDQGRLRLDSTLYDVLGRPPLPRRPSDPRVYQITVRQLLHHAAGWNTDIVGWKQPFLNKATRNGPIDFEQYVLMVMCEPLDYAPGSESHYSNWQFAVLKLVVEHASGMPYAAYVRQQVLAPMGINDVIMERPPGQYARNEALRYNSKNWQPYPGGHTKWPLRHGALGGWLASAIDMAKFMTAMDGSRIQFLSPYTYHEMLAPPPPPAVPRPNGSWFGLGWDRVLPAGQGVEFTKNGGVDGVHTQIVHMPNGTDFIVFLNGSGLKINGQPDALTSALQQIKQAIRQTYN